MDQNQSESKKAVLSRLKGTDFAVITIQNPPMNFLSGEVLMLLRSYLEKVREDEKTKALFIEGKGLFSAGADVNDIWGIAQSGDRQKALELLAKANEVVNALENLGKPTIALIDGYCLGGGNELAMACMMRISTERAKSGQPTQFGQPEINLGIIPGMGGTQRLPRLVSLEKSLFLLLSGGFIPAKDALESGLIDKVVPTQDDLIPEAKTIAWFLLERPRAPVFKILNLSEMDFLLASDRFKTMIQSKSSEAVKAVILAVREGMIRPLPEALNLEQELFADVVFTEPARRGMAKLLGINLDHSRPKGGSFIFLKPDSDIFTAYDLTEDQRMIRDTLKDFMANEVLPQTVRIESKEWDVTRNLLLKLGELGVLGIEVPEQYGGQNLDKTTAAILAEELGWQGSFACTVLADTGIGMLPIVLFGNEEQKNRFLPSIVSGKIIGAYSLTESGAGSDAKAITTKAVLREDGRAYQLNGEKIFVTNGRLADFYILFAKVGDDREITAFIVEREFPGVEVGNEEHKMGILGSSTTSVSLFNVSVPVENILGRVGEGFSIAMNTLNLGRFKLGAACLGGSRQIFYEALKYSRERKQFQVPIDTFGSIRKKLCQIAALIYGIESMVYRTAGLLDKAVSEVDLGNSRATMEAIREYAGECSIVKVWCSESNYQNAVANVEIHGGNGFMKDYSAERHLRDSVINMIFEGTNSINRLLLVKEFLKKFGMGLISEKEKMWKETTSVSPFEATNDVVLRLCTQLERAKKVFIIVSGLIMKKFGFTLSENDNQEAVILLADCLINLYVLDSALAVYVKHRKEKDQYLTRYLFHLILPVLERDVMSLVVLGSEADQYRDAFADIRPLLSYEPENVLNLNKKITENF